jgi:ubiquinone biosynthesis protein
MHVSLRPARLWRYSQVARLLWRHGRKDLVRSAGLEAALSGDALPSEAEDADAQALARDLERMGPTFIKLGQVLSTRSELLPTAYLTALARLQDRVEPVPGDEAVAIVERELGMPLAASFREFDRDAFAGASLGQVHYAVLPDGRSVAVKVQRPGIRARIAQDLAALEDIAGLLDDHTETGRRLGCRGLLAEFRRSLVRELDYEQEARNLVTLAKNLEGFRRIVVPLPVDGYTTARVLTMDYVDGRRLSRPAVLSRRDVDGSQLADELLRAYLKQVLVDGFFHADPHPGNLFLTEDGRIALLDLGMVSCITPAMQEKLLRWLVALGEGRGEEAANIALQIGKPRPDMDRAAFRRRVSEMVMLSGGANLHTVQMGRIVLDAARIADECGLAGPRELTMLGKALLNLDGIGRVLDPEFDPNASMRRNAALILQRQVAQRLAPDSVMSSLLGLSRFASHLPARVNRILDTVANNELEVKVDAIDERRLIGGLQKIANRITLGLLLAALVVAAALLMRVPTTFRLLGYPGIAIVLFVAAAAGGIALVVSIVLHDRQPERGD